MKQLVLLLEPMSSEINHLFEKTTFTAVERQDRELILFVKNDQVNTVVGEFAEFVKSVPYPVTAEISLVIGDKSAPFDAEIGMFHYKDGVFIPDADIQEYMADNVDDLYSCDACDKWDRCHAENNDGVCLEE